MLEDSFDVSTGIRQRTSYASQQQTENTKTATDGEESANMSSIRVVVMVISMLGVVSFSSFAALFGARYAFFGFHGNMEEAASSCWQTAILFAIIAVVAGFPAITKLFTNWRRAYTLNKKHVLPGAYRR